MIITIGADEVRVFCVDRESSPMKQNEKKGKNVIVRKFRDGFKDDSLLLFSFAVNNEDTLSSQLYPRPKD